MSKFYALVEAGGFFVTTLRRFGFTVAFFLLLAGNTYGQEHDGWEFYRNLSLSAATPLNDFQVKIVLNGSAQHVHMKNDGGDLRFYSADGSVKYDYFLEKFDPNGLSVIWVKVPGAGTTSLRMYYGNPAAVGESDGYAVFDFFDDFEGTSLKPGWQTKNSSEITVSGSWVHLNLNTSGENEETSVFREFTEPSYNYSVELKHNIGGYFRNRYYVTDKNPEVEKPQLSEFDYYFRNSTENSDHGIVFWKNLRDEYFGIGTDYIMKWEIFPGTTTLNYRWYNLNANQTSKWSNSETVSQNMQYIYIGLTEGRSSTKVDWVRIRKTGTVDVNIGTEKGLFSIPVIIQISANEVCEGEEIVITGNFESNFNERVVKLNNHVLNIVSQSNTSITASVGAQSGNLRIETGSGISQEILPVNVNLKHTVDEGNPLSDICEGESTEKLGGSFGGGANGAVWTVDVSGGIFENAEEPAISTWRPPAGFSGTATFTISTVGNSCGVKSKTKSVLVKPKPSLPANSLSMTRAAECISEEITFAAPGGFANYEFFINGTSKTFGTNPVFKTKDITGSENRVKVRVGQNGCFSVDSTNTFSVYAYPVGDFLASESSGKNTNDSTICQGDEVILNFTDRSVYTNNSYAFFIQGESDTLYKGSGTSFTYNATVNGNKFGVRVTGQAGCAKTFWHGPFQVHALPTGNLTATNTEACIGDEVSFTAPSGFMSYKWYQNNEKLEGGPYSSSAIQLNVSAGNELIEVEVADLNGCSAKLEAVEVTVHALPIKPTIIGPSTYCGGETTILSVSGGPYSSYSWFKNGSAISGATGATLEVGQSANYKVEVKNESGCSSLSAEFGVAEKPLPAVPVIGGGNAFCEGESLTLTSSYNSGNQWFKSDEAIPGETSATFTTEEAGSFTVKHTATNGCSSISAVKTIERHNLPSVPVITSGGSTVTSIELCNGDSSTLEAPSGFSYQWYSNNELITNETLRTLQVTQSGNYRVRITNENGCSSKSPNVTATNNPLPNPVITASVSQICPGSTITYTATPAMQSYVWEVPEGEIPISTNGNVMSITWSNTTGLKYVKVTVTDNKGCSSQGQNQPTETSEITPKITEHNNTGIICQNDEISYSTDAGFENYLWEVTGGTINGAKNTNQISVKWDKTGERKVSVNYTNNGCQSPTPGVLVVDVKPVPDASITGNATVCQESPSPQVTFTGSKGTFPYTFDYYISSSGQTGQPQTTAAGNPVHVAVSTDNWGEYVYHLRSVTDSNGCYKEFVTDQHVTVTISPKPVVLNFNYASTPYCNNLTDSVYANFEGTEGGVFSASSNNLKLNASTGNFSPSTSIPGSYVVTYRISPVGGCAELVKTTNVTITPLPVISKFYYGSETNPSFCNSNNSIETPVLTGSNLIGGKFSASEGFDIDENTGRFNPVTQQWPGTYTVTYRILAANGCEEVVEDATVIITPVPDATFSYGNTVFCSSDNAIAVTNLTSTAPGFFSISNGGATISENGTVNANNSPGTYTIKYAIPAQGGCNAADFFNTITINSRPVVSAGDDLPTCVNTGSIGITVGAIASKYTTLGWSSRGDGAWTNQNSLLGAKYTPGSADIAAGRVTLVLTANQPGCAPVEDEKVLHINQNPAPVVVKPESAIVCLDEITPLLSVKDRVTSAHPTFNSTSSNSIPDNLASGIANKISVSGIPNNAVIDEVRITINISHPNARELIGNIRSPLGKELNLFYRIPQDGANFTNTVFSSLSDKPIQTFGSPSFTGTYKPQAQFASMGLAFAKNTSDLYTSSSSLNGEWTLKVADNLPLNTGDLLDWKIQIFYSLPEIPIPVVWSPHEGLYTDASASIPYTGDEKSLVYVKIDQVGETVYTARSIGSNECSTDTQVPIIIKSAPTVKITTDYCSEPGYAVLSATVLESGKYSYNWNTGQTGPKVRVDEANDYYVSATDSITSCVGTGMISVATELVVNGDFEQGNTGFTTGYTYTNIKPEGLYSDGNYTVDSVANQYHPNFWGRDHSTLEQKGRFMIVNGVGSQKVVWEQTVKVEPQTYYYYSAWAMNLNSIEPFARLSFEVNGELMGTVAELGIAPKPSNESEININNWIRFYYGHDDAWFSGDNTTATIKIVNLEPNWNGNDFGLDDISFATISPFVEGPDIPGSDQQLHVCSNTDIIPINYKIGTGKTNPVVSGIPEESGITTTFDGLNFTIKGRPLNTSKFDKVYNYTISVDACGTAADPKVASGTIVVKPASTITLTSNNSEQHLCVDQELDVITYSIGGSATTTIIEPELPAGITSSQYDGETKISGSSNQSGRFAYTIRTEGGDCAQETLNGVITISPLSVGGFISSPTVCFGEVASLQLKDYEGDIKYWQSSDDELNWSNVPNSNHVNSLTYNNVEASKYFRAIVQNELCSVDTSDIGKIRITGLWEGRQSSDWHNNQNWSAGVKPGITNSCSNTVVIPPVASNRHNPVVSTLEGISNLKILQNGYLTIGETGMLQIGGLIQNMGTINSTEGGLEFNGSIVQTLSGGLLLNKVVKNLKVSNLNSLNISSSAGDTLNITGTLSFGKPAAKIFTGNNITLKSTHDATASVDVVNATNLVAGKFIVERFINTGTEEYTDSHGKSWQLLSTPVKNVSIRNSWQEGGKPISGVANEKIEDLHPGYGTLLTTGRNNVFVNGFDAYTAPGPSMKTYVPGTNSWDSGPSSTADDLYNEHGYMIMVRGDRSVYHFQHQAKPTVLRAKGNIITGTTLPIAVPVNSFQSIGNPYASSIRIDAVVGNRPGIKNFISFWDPTLSGGYGLGGYVTLSQANDGTYEATPQTSLYQTGITTIQSGQAFFVQSEETQGGTITFSESFKTSGSNLVMRPRGILTSSSVLRINLYDGNNQIADGVKLQFNDEYSNEIDRMDGRKMMNNSENLAIRSNNKLLVIESRKIPTTTDTIFLNLTGVRVSQYRFEFDPKGLENRYLQAYLEDSYKGTRTPVSLTEKSVLSFSVENVPGSYASSRFIIVFKGTAALPIISLDVTAEVLGEQGNMIRWEVNHAEAAGKYIVERSIDGIQYMQIYDTRGGAKNYQWLDEVKSVGEIYYRVLAVAKDGQMMISKIVKISSAAPKASISIYPNPIVNDHISIHFVNKEKGEYVIKVLDTKGRIMLVKEVKHPGGNNLYNIEWNNKWARGMYQVEVLSGQSVRNVFPIKY